MLARQLPNLSPKWAVKAGLIGLKFLLGGPIIAPRDAAIPGQHEPEHEMASAPAIVLNPTINQRLAGLAPAQRLRFVLGIALFVIVGGLGLFMGRQADWRVLYTNLADKDGGAIVAQLSQMNVPYKHAEGVAPFWYRLTRCTTPVCGWLPWVCQRAQLPDLR